MNKSGFIMSAAVLGVTGAVFAQCGNSPTLPVIPQNDAANCGPQDPVDPNGGCNYSSTVPVPFQELGTIGNGAVVRVDGTIGTFTPTGGTSQSSRDLDWFKFTIANNSLVSLDLGNFTLNNTVLFLLEWNTDCNDYVQLYGVQGTGTCQSADFALEAGTYVVIATTPFETDPLNPVYSCNDYSLTIEVQPSPYASCNSGAAACDVVHPTPGCNDFACCNTICATDPLCCDLQWDGNCVQYAVDLCGYFIYTCTAPQYGNDCLTSPSLKSVGDTFAATNLNANTDGPGNSPCASKMGHDLWYTVKAPGNGALTFNACATDFDSVIEVYALGDSPVIANPQTLPDYYIGCVDDSCGTTGGPETVTIVDAIEDEYYLFRVGGWRPTADPPAAGAMGNIGVSISFSYVVYTTGPQKYLVSSAGANTNLGLSSGAISASAPQRWLATPWVVPTPPAGNNKWRIREITPAGFSVAGTTNTNLNYIIWNRTGFNKPVNGDQVVAGFVPFPTPYDDALDSAANASHPIAVDFELNPGNYYLTVYASDPANPAIFSNFAWFIYAPGGIAMTDAQGAFGWRSVTFPTGGFLRYTLAGYTVQAGDDANTLYNVKFTVLGEPEGSTGTPGDLNGDGIVNAADLAILLGAWGTSGPGDFNGDGIVNAADLATLLGYWT